MKLPCGDGIGLRTNASGGEERVPQHRRIDLLDEATSVLNGLYAVCDLDQLTGCDLWIG